MVTARVCASARLLKIKNKLKTVVFRNKVRRILDILWTFFIKRQIPLALVGYGMIIANSLVIYLLISNAHSWNNCSLFR